MNIQFLINEGKSVTIGIISVIGNAISKIKNSSCDGASDSPILNKCKIVILNIILNNKYEN